MISFGSPNAFGKKMGGDDVRLIPLIDGLNLALGYMAVALIGTPGPILDPSLGKLNDIDGVFGECVWIRYTNASFVVAMIQQE